MSIRSLLYELGKYRDHCYSYIKSIHEEVFIGIRITKYTINEKTRRIFIPRRRGFTLRVYT